MEFRKLTQKEIEEIKNSVNHGGRKSLYDEYLKDMQIGDMVEVQNVNRGVISRAGQRLGYKLSVHYVNGKYYVERTA